MSSAIRDDGKDKLRIAVRVILNIECIEYIKYVEYVEVTDFS